MEYFSERNGLRNPVNGTEDMTFAMYDLIMACCQQYFENIAYKYPDRDCQDGDHITGLDLGKLSTDIQFEIPDLYRDENGLISITSSNLNDFNQYAVLDFVEFMSMNMRDVSKKWHNYFQHYHLYHEATNLITQKFKQDINLIFRKTGLQYELTDAAQVERIMELTPLISKTDHKIKEFSEEGIRELLKEAIDLYKTPREGARQLSIEKLWDAFERLKTYYRSLNKKNSVDKICLDMSEGKDEVYKLVSAEFKELTAIGNAFRIRHHETNKHNINSTYLSDYFFNRCISLVNFALFYLE